MHTLISIIVPIYKVEQYLNRCVESIVNQTYKNLEIILVDDGSPDGCGEMCDQWAEIDNRINVIHKRNGGLSDARNAGLKIASGELIGFVDSDDWIHPQMYEKLFEIMNKQGADIVSCNYLKKTTKESNDLVDICSEVELSIYSSEEALRELILDKKLQQVVWNKLYKRDVVNRNLFEIGKCNEDEFWSYQVISFANKVVTADFVGYFYYQRPDSIIGQTYSLKRLDGLEGREKRFEFIKDKYPELESLARLNLYYSACYAYQCSLRSLGSEELKIAKRKILNILKKCPIDKSLWKNETLKQKIWLVLYHVSIDWTCRLRNLLKKGL